MSSTPSNRVCRYNTRPPGSVTSLDQALAGRITSCVRSRTLLLCQHFGSLLSLLAECAISCRSIPLQSALESVQARRVIAYDALSSGFGLGEAEFSVRYHLSKRLAYRTPPVYGADPV